MKIHKKPIDQSPSKVLFEHIDLVNIVDAPIANIACGYGRNGALFVDLGHKVIFVCKKKLNIVRFRFLFYSRQVVEQM